jgi:DMSO/TMAO reductase YedYZ molybdopterin-dependent catalytic subunit
VDWRHAGGVLIEARLTAKSLYERA